MEKKSAVDEMSDVEFARALVLHFGGKRMTELTGWVILFGLSGFKSGSEMRAHLEARGLSKSAMYRALADLKEFGDAMDAERAVSMSGQEVARRFARTLAVPT
jgi:hypothetical protein